MDRVLVLDFGGQYCHLIARRLRELGVGADIAPARTRAASIAADPSVKALVLSGGPRSVYERGAPQPDPAIFQLALPILGICYGHQLLGKHGKAVVRPGKTREYGKRRVRIDRRSPLFAGLAAEQWVWMSHGDAVSRPPRGFLAIARSNGLLAGIEDRERKRFGLQFHPEVVHTKNGSRMLRNFIRIAGVRKGWDPAGCAERAVAATRARVGPREHVLMAVSGGVDSTVAALLVRKAVGKRFHGVFIDHGLLREGEAAQARRIFARLGLPVQCLDESGPFLAALQGVRDPERKRRAIGHQFIRAFEAHAHTLDARLRRRGERLAWLAQGTIYPDRIESAQAGTAAEKIKTHHNLALPERMRLKVLEPLADLYKDEVRAVGRGLGIPHELLERQPFPGPGLAVRCMGAVTVERLAVLRKADAIFQSVLAAHGYDRRTWQAFAALLDARAVGVQGDARSYGQVVALRAVTAVDGMTADWAKLPADLLEEASSRITNEVAGVNRVVYDVTQKPPATIEFE
ncbi:MAG TPA: glutamine-hydrolyzing GMP synthase [archaeon]|nr:glutamine-hydrolyzing GMP synthase [archaeon]